MPYKLFTLDRVRTEFDLKIDSRPGLFQEITPRPLDPAVVSMISRFRGLAITINTEKARSELLIAPLLSEVWRIGAGRVALFSGVAFNVDPDADLTGVCDFILGNPPQLDYVTNPVMMIAEAKNESLMGGMGQCAAAMVAAQRFNRTRENGITVIYGCVSNGIDWKFLRLTNSLLEIDVDDYVIHEPERILGILLQFVGLGSAAPVAA